jgi:hypothetical protein
MRIGFIYEKKYFFQKKMKKVLKNISRMEK